MGELYLIYINVLGTTWLGENVYEFLFSDTIEDVDGEYWDKFPAAGTPEPPKTSFVKLVGVLTIDMGLMVIQESDTFAVWDAVDKITALAWEDISDYEEYPEKRLFFNFGEKISDVKDKLYHIDNVLIFKEDGKEEIN